MADGGEEIETIEIDRSSARSEVYRLVYRPSITLTTEIYERGRRLLRFPRELPSWSLSLINVNTRK